MLAKEGEYVIIREGDKKHNLVKVTRLTGKRSFRGVVADHTSADPNSTQTKEFEADAVVANLGDDPKPGNAYNVKIHPFRGYVTLKGIGTLFYMRKCGQKERNLIEKKLKFYMRKLQRDGLFFGKEVEFFVEPPRGAWAGYYQRKKKEDKPDKLALVAEQLQGKELSYYITHEAGHGIWFTRMSPEIQAMWVNAFHRNITLNKIKSERVASLREELVSSGRVEDCRKSLDEDDRQAFRECLRYIKRVHSLEFRHLNALMENDDDLTAYWPKASVDLQRKQVMVSEYAMKSPDEFWCEAFSFHYSNYKIVPKSILKLLKRTMAKLKASSGSRTARDMGGDDDDTED